MGSVTDRDDGEPAATDVAHVQPAPPTLAAPARPKWRTVLRHGIVVISISLGAAAGYRFEREPGLLVIGGLLGFLVGRTFAPPPPADPSKRNLVPSAYLCFVLSAGAWLPVAFLAGYMFLGGLFGGEGAGLLLLLVLPAVGICWLVGGPMASRAGRDALEQIKQGARPDADLWFARTGLALSRGMTFALFGVLLWLLCLIYA